MALTRTARRMERAAGKLATGAVARMDAALPWFGAMPPDQRAWVGLVVQAGIATFSRWLRHPDGDSALTNQVFGTAPRELARSVTLQQAVELVRVAVESVEEQVPELAAPGEEDDLRSAVLRYSREIAFATALVYARTAEERGAWDARLEALVVDAVLREESSDNWMSRAAALGWSPGLPVAVVVGPVPAGSSEGILDRVQRAARRTGAHVLAGVQGERLVAIVGARDPWAVGRGLAAEFGAGPVVLGPRVPDLSAAGSSAAAALAGWRAAGAWPGAPRPVPADELLPERALDGDPVARNVLLEEIYRPLLSTAGHLLDTLAAYLESGGSLEGTARALFIHTNTVRYRLRRVSEVTGYLPTDPRQGYLLHVALTLGRLWESSKREPPTS